ncbi:MAG: CRISPR system precrRNA processing endoribonuclease RAMP protein Cas6, partial [Acidobacteriota bacterium]|nr:CRISPR system precrRNA processing endoribonuclease RAMP protein Cas6 [Acidobacteriota bacterium]
PVVCEGGRVRYEVGDGYCFGISLIELPGEWAERLEEGLRRVGEEGSGQSGLLAGNFRVEAVEQGAAVDLRECLQAVQPWGPREASPGAGRQEVRLRFLSPLRLKLPRELQKPRSGYCHRDCFPAGHFLQRLAARLFLLTHGRFPSRDERAEFLSTPADLEADTSDLVWVDVPAPGRHQQKRTLGGVLGEVVLRGVPTAWIPYLLAGQHAHVGSSTAFGLGRYEIEGFASVGKELFSPARPLLAEVADPRSLHRALDRLQHKGKPDNSFAGVDGETLGELLALRGRRISELSFALASGTYRPSRLLGVVQRDSNGARLPRALPTVADRVLRQAAAEVLREPLRAFGDVASEAFRRGHRKHGARQALHRAWREGYCLALRLPVEVLWEQIEPESILRRLEALFPHEPLVPWLRRWLEVKVEPSAELLTAAGLATPPADAAWKLRGLSVACPLTPILVQLGLDDFEDRVLEAGQRLLRHGRYFVVLLRDLPEDHRPLRWLPRGVFPRRYRLVERGGVGRGAEGRGGVGLVELAETGGARRAGRGDSQEKTKKSRLPANKG